MKHFPTAGLLLPSLLFFACVGVKRARVLQQEYGLTGEPFALALREPASDSIRLQYIGCGGFLIRHGDEAVLLDPYFSNAVRVIWPFRRLRSDTALIDSFFRDNFQDSRDRAGVIRTVLLSHAHYDHFADVPALWQNNLAADRTTFAACATAGNLLQTFSVPFDPATQFIDLDDSLSQAPGTQFRWTPPGSRFRITAVPSMHAPHFCGAKIPGMGGDVPAGRRKRPKTIFGFKEGHNYNYLIDYLDPNGSIVFRIFSNAGAACNAPVGFPPPGVLAEKKVDVLLICGASYNQVSGYPDSLIKAVQPAYVWVCHWEHFFKSIPSLRRKPRTVPGTPITALMKHLKKVMRDAGIATEPVIVLPLTSAAIKY